MLFTVDGIIVDLVLLIILIGNAIIGYRKGLVKIVFNLLSSIIAIIFVLVFCKPTTNFIMEHTQIPNSIETAIGQRVELIMHNGTIQAGNQAQNQIETQTQDKNMVNILKIFIGDNVENILQQATSSIVQTISHEITYKIISVLVFFALFIIVRFLLFILRNYLQWISELPFLDILDSIGGIIYGIISGVVLIYVGLAIVSMLMPFYGNSSVFTAIQQSIVGSRMLNNNIVLGLIFKFF